MLESKIFKNEDALSPDYLPEILPHRETQVETLARNIETVSKRKKPQNTFIFGPPGTGKTASAKYVFRQFEEFSGIHTIYINTWDYKTTNALLTKIILSLNYPIPRRGLSKDEILEKLVEVLKKLNKGLVICLDEVDQLVRNDEKALYDLLRINQYVDTPISLIMISNYKDVFVSLEPRIKSSLDLNEIEFKAYTLQEMKDILQDRCKESFISPVEDGVVLLCANHALSRGGDVRVGLECLRKASCLAEESSDIVRVKDVRQILDDVKAVKLNIVRDRLEGVDKNIVSLLSSEKEYKSTDFHSDYVNNYGDISQYTLTTHLKHLNEMGIVKLEESRRGTRGRKMFIRIFKKKKFN